jgi:hypothetical protein
MDMFRYWIRIFLQRLRLRIQILQPKAEDDALLEVITSSFYLRRIDDNVSVPDSSHRKINPGLETLLGGSYLIFGYAMIFTGMASISGRYILEGGPIEQSDRYRTCLIC